MIDADVAAEIDFSVHHLQCGSRGRSAYTKEICIVEIDSTIQISLAYTKE